jgi:hypothetical protein
MAAGLKKPPHRPPVLIIFSVLIALLMGVLLGSEWVQRQTIKEQGRQRIEFLMAPAFLLDREFVRLTNSIEGFLEARPSHPEDELRMRMEIFLSKVRVIRESPGTALMLEDAKVAQSVAQLAAFGQRAEPPRHRLLTRPPDDRGQ